MYADGSEDAFAVPQATLDQGPGAAGVARIVAAEWQRDGYLKPGKIVGGTVAQAVCAELNQLGAVTRLVEPCC
jgi:hypothetical protein